MKISAVSCSLQCLQQIFAETCTSPRKLDTKWDYRQQKSAANTGSCSIEQQIFTTEWVTGWDILDAIGYGLDNTGLLYSIATLVSMLIPQVLSNLLHASMCYCKIFLFTTSIYVTYFSIIILLLCLYHLTLVVLFGCYWWHAKKLRFEYPVLNLLPLLFWTVTFSKITFDKVSWAGLPQCRIFHFHSSLIMMVTMAKGQRALTNTHKILDYLQKSFTEMRGRASLHSPWILCQAECMCTCVFSSSSYRISSHFPHHKILHFEWLRR